jgi:hypothetical protein
VGLGFALRAFELTKQAHPRHLSSSPFYSGYFGDGGGSGLRNYLPGLALNHDPPNLSLPRSPDYRHEPLVPTIVYFHVCLLACFFGGTGI